MHLREQAIPVRDVDSEHVHPLMQIRWEELRHPPPHRRVRRRRPRHRLQGPVLDAGPRLVKRSLTRFCSVTERPLQALLDRESASVSRRVPDRDTWTQQRCGYSEHYQTEIDHLGIARSPAFHYEPETNGCAEKFIQTLKEQVLWIQRFQTFEELRAAVRSFADTYNQSWLLERHGYRTPIEAREHLLALTPTTLA